MDLDKRIDELLDDSRFKPIEELMRQLAKEVAQDCAQTVRELLTSPLEPGEARLKLAASIIESRYP